MNVQPSKSIVIDAPEFFADAQFKEWLENGEPKFTYYQGGEIDEWSDVVVLVDPGLNGNGSDSDMPEHIWDQIVEACRQHIGPGRGCSHYMVRLTNLGS